MRLPRPLVIAFVFCSGCYTWRNSDIPAPDRSSSWTMDGPARVGLRDGSEIRTQSLRLISDTIIGVSSLTKEVRIPLADVRSIHARRFSAIRTAGVAAGAGAVVFLSLVLRELWGYGGPTSFDSPR